MAPVYRYVHCTVENHITSVVLCVRITHKTRTGRELVGYLVPCFLYQWVRAPCATRPRTSEGTTNRRHGQQACTTSPTISWCVSSLASAHRSTSSRLRPRAAAGATPSPTQASSPASSPSTAPQVSPATTTLRRRPPTRRTSGVVCRR